MVEKNFLPPENHDTPRGKNNGPSLIKVFHLITVVVYQLVRWTPVVTDSLLIIITHEASDI